MRRWLHALLDALLSDDPGWLDGVGVPPSWRGHRVPEDLWTLVCVLGAAVRYVVGVTLVFALLLVFLYFAQVVWPFVVLGSLYFALSRWVGHWLGRAGWWLVSLVGLEAPKDAE